MESNALMPGRIAFYCLYIPHVLSFCGCPKVVPPIVEGVFVNMVNLMSRPFSRLANPNKNVRFVNFFAKANIDAAFFAFNRCASQFSSGSTARANAPSQFSRLRAIIKMLANGVRIRFCHLANLNHPYTNVNVGSFN